MESNVITDESALRGKRFRLKTKLSEKRQSFHHAVSNLLIERHSQILVPESNDETTRFLTAFARGDGIELVVDIVFPINVRGRVSIQKPDDKCRLYHLHVMSECMIERLKLLPTLSTVELVTVPIDDPAQEESF